ncbi:MAG: hypothetical protein WBA16_04720 [Nonlabens sp.]
MKKYLVAFLIFMVSCNELPTTERNNALETREAQFGLDKADYAVLK